GFIANVPGYYGRLKVIVGELPWLHEVFQHVESKQAVGGLVSGNDARTVLVSLWAGGKSVVSFLSLLVVTPVVTFYLMVDWHKIVRALDGWVPLDHREVVRGLVIEIDRVITAFVRGQLAVCCILGAFYGVSLWLVGLNFGWVIGLAAGFLTFVPYVGS